MMKPNYFLKKVDDLEQGVKLEKEWFDYFLLIVFIVSIILLILVFIKEGFPLP